MSELPAARLVDSLTVQKRLPVRWKVLRKGLESIIKEFAFCAEEYIVQNFREIFRRVEAVEFEDSIFRDTH